MSDNLDSEGDEEPAPKKRKLTAAATAKLKAKEKAKEKAKRKKAGKGSDAEEDEDEEDDEYTAPSKGIQAGAIPGAPPPIGSLQECAKCEEEFTVVSCFSVRLQNQADIFLTEDARYDGSRSASRVAVPRLCEGERYRPFQTQSCCCSSKAQTCNRQAKNSKF